MNDDRRKHLLILRVWRVFGAHGGSKQIASMLFFLSCVDNKAVGQVKY